MEDIAYEILDDGSVHFYIVVDGRKVSDFIVPHKTMSSIVDALNKKSENS